MSFRLGSVRTLILFPLRFTQPVIPCVDFFFTPPLAGFLHGIKMSTTIHGLILLRWRWSLWVAFKSTWKASFPEAPNVECPLDSMDQTGSMSIHEPVATVGGWDLENYLTFGAREGQHPPFTLHESCGQSRKLVTKRRGQESQNTRSRSLIILRSGEFVLWAKTNPGKTLPNV